jgi:adenylate kinase
MLNIALFGPPGAGKGTQSKKLIEKYNLTYISTGDILRQEIAEGSDLGLQAKSIIEKGGLASDEIIVQIIEKKINMHRGSKGILFDGFPRTLVQAYILEGLLQKMNSSLSCMLSLEVPDDELVNRLLERGKTSGRADDNLEVIKYRLNEYHTKTAVVANFYKEKKKYYPIKGVGSMDDVFKRLTSSINEAIRDELFNIVLLGPPGVGKGTQGRLLAKKYNMYYISTGSLIRAEVKNNTEIGEKAKPFLEKGEIVPDEIAIKLIEREIKSHPNARGYIFKGFPRTLVQAYILDGLLQRINTSVSVVVNMEAPTLQLVKRLDARGKTSKARPYDKSVDLIVRRLEEYETKTKLTLSYYEKQEKVITVDCDDTEGNVEERLSETINKSIELVR